LTATALRRTRFQRPTLTDLDRATPYLLALAIVGVQQVFFGVPLGIFVRGVIVGLLTALIALGMALTYRSNRFVNFAQGDLGAVPVVLMVMLMSAWHWSYGLSLASGLVGALVLGAVVELAIIRRFFRSPHLLLTVASIGLAQLLTASGLLMPKLWGADFPLLGKRLDPPFDMELSIGTVVFNANDVIALVVAPIALIALAVFLRSSSVGVAIRASADSADRASLLGVPVKRLQTVVWAIAAVLAFLAIFLRAGIVGLPIGSALSIGVLLRALGALVLGRMTNLPAIAANAVALGVLEVAIGFAADSPLLLDPILAGIIVTALFLTRRGSTRVDEGSVSTWRSADDVRPIPRELARVPLVRVVRWLLGTAGLVAVLVLPNLLTVDRSLKASALGIYAILGLSIVVLTGWAGQVSLGQVAFFAMGATFGAKATLEWDLDLSIALLLSAVVGAVVAVAVGLPALRRQGFYLAVTTLAFSLATTSYFLNPEFFDWIPRERVLRPPLFGRIDIDSPTAIYYLVLAVLVICLFALRGIRESRTGRALLAMRDNERGAQAYSINATRTRLVAFALSGALAAVAGCLFAHHQQAIGLQPYEPFQNLIVFTMVIIGGVTSPAGALLGALYLQGTFWFLPTEWQPIASGIGVLAILLILPGGLGGLAYRLRDRWLARVATSHNIEAPGLASAGAEPPADIEPDDIPLATESAEAEPIGAPP
jgi:branched-chain amino acid transport system permease protein